MKKSERAVLDRSNKSNTLGSHRGVASANQLLPQILPCYWLNLVKVGLIDADIYGPSFECDGMPIQLRRGSKRAGDSLEKYNVQVISTAFFLEGNQPLMWRGPMLNRMVKHFFYDVAWNDDLEYIIVDLPPGTGDVALDIQSIIPQCEMIVVTTPHPTAADIAAKAGLGAKQLNHKLLGVVENMAYYINPVNGQPNIYLDKAAAYRYGQLGYPYSKYPHRSTEK